MYQIALFIHILGVLCLMSGHTLLHASLEAMRRAQQVEQVRDWIAIAVGLDTFMPFFALAVLLPGIYMAWTAWGWTTPWIDVSLALFLIMMILGPILLGRRFAALNKMVKMMVPGSIQAPLAAQIRDRILWTIENTFTSLLLAILFLMTVKPNLLGTGIVVSIGFVIGLLSTVRMRRVAPPAALSSSTQRHFLIN
jgi:Predicted integral membrane protein (DUF2269)